jgi:hypothetical protein
MLSAEYRRTLPELKARYKLEPSLRDVYVEGPSDKAILEWYCAASGYNGVSVYVINSVNMPSSFVQALGMIPNNRSRVISLSMFLLDLSPLPSYAFCIADRDMEAASGLRVVNSRLEYTDFTCMEMYVYSMHCFSKMFTVYLGRGLDEAALWFRELSPFLQRLFAIRMACSNLGLNTSLPDVNKCVRWTKRGVAFDEKRYLKRVCEKCGFKGGDALSSAVEGIASVMTREVRNYIHGHDFMEAFRTLVVNIYKKSWLDEVGASRGLFLTLDVDYCRSFEMFKAIDRRLGTAQ